MSFNIYLNVPASPPCPTCGHGEPEPRCVHEWHGCTHNLDNIVEAALAVACSMRLDVPRPLPVRGNQNTSWGRFNGHRAGDVAAIIFEFERVICGPTCDRELRALNPPNGWGSLDEMRPLVSALADAVRKYPNAVFDCRG